MTLNGVSSILMSTTKEARTRREVSVARWIGEGLREAAVLIIVFVPLDWMLGRRDSQWTITVFSVAIATVLFWIGCIVGFWGESWKDGRRRHDS
ncbi:MAG: hypothetical protein HKL90_12175 [Elusimicrobia bacterium]|nr:hypothetical protein [Elusimicrobiota bacterium]